MRLSISFALLISAPTFAVSQQALTAPSASIDWHPTPAALTARCDAALTAIRGSVAAALSRRLAERTFDNSLKPIELAATAFGREVYPLTFLYQVAPDSAVRAASAACDSKVQSYFVEFNA